MRNYWLRSASLVLAGALGAPALAAPQAAPEAPIRMTARDMSLATGEVRFFGVELSFDTAGNLIGAAVLRGPAEHRQRALQVVLAGEHTDPPATLRIDLRLVSPSETALNRLVHVQPNYPALAKAGRISGEVELEAVIGPDGAVRDVSVIAGQALLRRAAIEAVRQWRYEPHLLNGTPVPVVTPITVRFSFAE